MSDEDWLETPASKALVVPAAIPAEFVARVALVEECWGRLSFGQRTFLTAWRETGFNIRAASRRLRGDDNKRTTHEAWQRSNPDYVMVMRLWRAMAAEKALDRDRLLARQDAIVEDLLTPKPVLHQGIPVLHEGQVLEEVEAGAASRANEVLLQAAGVIKSGKDTEVNVNVGVSIGPPTLNIQVMPRAQDKIVQRESVAIDAKFTEVPDDEWLGA